MNPMRRPAFGAGVLPLLVMGLSGAIACRPSSPSPSAQRRAAPAATLDCAADTPAGAAVSLDLWAKAGTATLPGLPGPLPVWGYTAAAADLVTAPGGPTLVVGQGQAVTITLHNDLAEASALLLQGQELPPDLAGAPAGGTATYTFTAAAPGTFLYEAGLLPNAQHQVAMGLYGALVVRPASPSACQAYGDAASAFDDEAVLVLSEVDPALNADPAAFDLRNWAPRFFLINGQAFPATANVPTGAGRKVLLRTLNAGLLHHSMALLGMRQSLVAVDGSPRAYPMRVVAETVAPGQTQDTIATVPSGAAAGTRFAFYEGSLKLHNNGGAGFGGMLTFLVVGGAPGGGSGLPIASNVAVSPAGATAGDGPVVLSATLTSPTPLAGAEFFVDVPGAAGSGCSMGGGGAASATLSPSGGCAPLSSLADGTHILYVHGQNGAGWGPFGFAALVLDRTGPAVYSIQLSPNPSNGSAEVALSATADDTLAGGGNIAAAELFLDPGGAPPPGTGTALAVLHEAAPFPTESAITEVSGGIPAATMAALSDGVHTVAVRARDALGNWGALVFASLVKTTAGPVTSGVALDPTATNGLQGYASAQPLARVTATFTDLVSPIAAAEGFIDAAGAPGTGFSFLSDAGGFAGLVETGYTEIPLTHVALLAAGNHTIYVRARNAVGNWGGLASGTLLVDRTAPTFTGLTESPSPVARGTPAVLTVLGAADPLVGGLASGVTGGEYWLDNPAAPAPGQGTGFAGTSASVPTGALSSGTHTARVRVRDGAGNWSSGAGGIRSVSFVVTP